MSRVYLTAEVKHKNWPFPTLSVATSDHTGGFHSVQGVHPASLSALHKSKGKPHFQKKDRFDLKFNVNPSRCTFSVIVNTTKHLPHWEWDSDKGAGPIPPILGTMIPVVTSLMPGLLAGVKDKVVDSGKDKSLGGSKSRPKAIKERSDGRDSSRSRSSRTSRSSASRLKIDEREYRRDSKGSSAQGWYDDDISEDERSIGAARGDRRREGRSDERKGSRQYAERVTEEEYMHYRR